MAKLGTIEKHFDIRIANFLNSVLTLSDEYIIIINPLNIYNKFNDYVVTIFSKDSIFFISYQKIIQDNLSIEDAIIYIREYFIKFNSFLISKNINIDTINLVTNLIIVTTKDIPEIYSKDDNVSIVHFDKIKNTILYSKKINNGVLSSNDINSILDCFKPSIIQKINKYQIISEIEFLDNIIVYLAYDTLKEKLFTLKEIKVSKEESKFQKKELLREAKLVMNLNHPNLLSIEEIIEKDNKLYIISEYLSEYVSLRELSNKRKLNNEEIISIIKQICMALEYTHNNKIIHRNIRPENILINSQLKVKISNFELAKKIDFPTRSTLDLKEILEENDYSAPELKIGIKDYHNIDQKVDIYSVGVVFYELLTGKIPKYIDEKNFLYPSYFNNDVSFEIDKIVEKALKFDINQRYSTITALKNALINYKYLKNENNSEIRYTNREIYKKTINSIIYQAFDNKLKRKVALKKIIIDGFLTSKERSQKLEKFLAEANILKKLINPNIVSVYDFFIEDEDAYIVMEWLEGKTLRELLRESDILPVNEVLNILFQICSAIDYAHYQNIIHKDIKPENIMYSGGKVTIIDFGLANLFNKEDNTRYGTAIYMAPEQINNNGIIDQRVDIFSIGILAYELFTNSYPYEPEIIINKYSKQKVYITDPSEINPFINKSLSNCILKAIRINPEERHSNIKEFVKELKLSTMINDKKNFNLLKLISIVMLILTLIYPIRYFISKQNFNNKSNDNLYVLMADLKEVLDGKIDSYIPYSNWEPSSILLDNVNIQSNVLENNNYIEIYLVINNFNDAKIHLFKDKKIEILDEYGNNYSDKVDLIPKELMEIEPNSFAKGFIIIKDKFKKDVNKLNIIVKGENNTFYFTLKKKANI